MPQSVVKKTQYHEIQR